MLQDFFYKMTSPWISKGDKYLLITWNSLFVQDGFERNSMSFLFAIKMTLYLTNILHFLQLEL